MTRCKEHLQIEMYGLKGDCVAHWAVQLLEAEILLYVWFSIFLKNFFSSEGEVTRADSRDTGMGRQVGLGCMT